MQTVILMATYAVVLVGVFLAIRQLVLWYWRINEHIEITKESRGYLKEIAAATTYLARQVSAEQNSENATPTVRTPAINAGRPVWREAKDGKG